MEIAFCLTKTKLVLEGCKSAKPYNKWFSILEILINCNNRVTNILEILMNFNNKVTNILEILMNFNNKVTNILEILMILIIKWQIL